MASTAVSAQGSNISINTGTTEAPVFTDIANVKSYTGMDGTAADIDVTDLKSTAKEKRVGLQDWGNFSFDVNVNYDDPGQQALLLAKREGTARQFELHLPDGTVVTFTAYVKSFPLTGGADAVLSATVSLSVDGDITVTPATGA